MFPPATERESFLKNCERRFTPSNEILPDDERNKVLNLITESQRALDSLDDEIYTIQAALHTLLGRRETEASHLERLRTGVAPHKKIPPEIFSLIFAHTISDKPAHMILWKRWDSPWNITQVCSRWRAIALSEAKLWKTMGLKVPQISSPETLFSHTRTPIQSHQSMECLHVGIPSMSLDLDLIFTLLSHCNNLREVYFSSESIAAVWISDQESLDTIPWSHLTSLMIPLISMLTPTFVGILHRCVNLVTLQATIQQNFLTEPMRAVEAAHLRSLELQTVVAEPINGVFPFLTLPSLETLSLNGDTLSLREALSFETMAHLINRSRCSVKHLVLQGFPFPSESIELCLPLMPDLVSLDTSIWEPISDPTLDLMRRENLVPNLETFSAGITSFQACRALLQERYNGMLAAKNRRMCKVHVVMSLREYQNERESIARFVEQHEDEGRRIVITWKGSGVRYEA